MSEDKAPEEQIRMLERRLALIQAVDQIRDLTVQDVQAMLTALAGLITDTLRADLCLLSLVEEESGELSLKTIVDRLGLSNPEALETIQRMTEQTLQQEQVLRWNADDDAAPQDLPYGVIVPIVLNGERLGTIMLANRERPFSEEEVTLLDLAEDQIDSALT
ncbi:MAG: GAF domain-containing protein, partial [Chloroflexi bacterium]